MKKSLKDQINRVPQKPGVYLFKDKSGRILYIGKAVKLRNRVRSHFAKNGVNIFKGDFLKNIADIDYIETKNEDQAFLLENQFIKKYKPRYNIQWRDDKSYFWVAFTDDEWPRVRVMHQTELARLQAENKTVNPVGPFVSGGELRGLLRALRRIFPFRTCKNPYDKPCLQWHLGLCPAHDLNLLVEPSGARSKAVKDLSKNPEYKKRSKKYFNLLNTLTQLLKLYAGEPIRIEAYDISNIHGNWATGSMIVFQGDKPKKSDYRRFKIKTISGANDVAMIKEIVSRRLKHLEWPYPDLMLIDGGITQLHAALAAAKNLASKTAIISLAKQEEEIYTEYAKRPLRLKNLPLSLRLTFQAIRNEAHRFAIFYYRHLHRKNLNSKTALKLYGRSKVRSH